MTLLEKYRRKFESNERPVTPGEQIMQPVVTNGLSEDVKEAYEEGAAIMEYDGGLDREDAERNAWCRTACMLSFPSQWKACERFYPKFCLKLTDTHLTDAAFGLPTEAVPEKSNKPELTN